MVRNFCLKWDACFKRDSYAWFKHEKCRLVLTKEKCEGGQPHVLDPFHARSYTRNYRQSGCCCEHYLIFLCAISNGLKIMDSFVQKQMHPIYYVDDGGNNNHFFFSLPHPACEEIYFIKFSNPLMIKLPCYDNGYPNGKW